MAEKYISQFTGEEIDARLQEVASKYGHIEMRFDGEKSMYYMDCYASKNDFTEGKEPIESVLIPISTVEGVSYGAVLTGHYRFDRANIVIDKQSLVFSVNYRSIKNDPTLGIVDAGYSGSLLIQRKTDTTDWETVDTLSSILDPQSSTDVYVDIDLTKYLIDGKQNIRLQAFYEFTDEDNNERKTARSSFVNVGSSIIKTSLRLDLMTEYHVPIKAYNDDGIQQKLNVQYRVFGACEKTLHIDIVGSVTDKTKSEIQNLTADINGTNKGVDLEENSTYGFLTHGVKYFTAWLEASDGLGGTIKSDVMTNSFMVINPKSETYDASKKYLLLQNRKEAVTNFIQSTLLQYAVYVESGESTEMTFTLTDSQQKEYISINRVAKNSTPYDLVTTVEIETEGETIPDNYKTRLYISRDGGTDFISEMGLSPLGFFDVLVDNSEAIVPMAGTTFLLNPKNRSNDEDNPYVIYNAAANNAVVSSEFSNFGLINDGWITDEEGYKVLRIMAGQKLTIKRNIWRQFTENPNSSLTIDIDFRVRNVTDTETPVININGGGTKGIIMNAMKGWVRTASYNDPDNCMFGWREGQRTYVSVNINHAVYPKKIGISDVKYDPVNETISNGSLALARVLVNGYPDREITFSTTSTTEWCDNNNAAIVIGNDGADIDIYSIRVYEKKQLNWIDLLNRNYLSSIPSTAEKQRIKRRNALLEGDRITLARVQELGLNHIIYHGSRPYIADKSDKAGWIEYFRYDQDGKLLREYSGTNCKASKLLPMKGQGSTATTYYEWNIQDDNSKVKDANNKTPMIQVSRADIHESINVTIEDNKAKVSGGNLGKDFPLLDTPKEYDYDEATDSIMLPDGWIDGNNKYRGMGYQVAEGTALAQKKVSKINYASAMQSHLLGACKSYDELHFAVVGASPMQKQYIDKGLTRPVFAKHTEPFLMFWDEGNGAMYTGLCVYGAGKMDKVAWGYVKSQHPMFSMIEGSDNNLPLTDFRVPFDKDVTYNVGEEYFEYNGEGSLDFDGGKTDDNDVPTAEIQKQWAQFHNFVYLNSPNIKFYDGTAASFRNQANMDTSSKYWCTQGEEAFHLLRASYKTVDQKTVIEWVNAGLWDGVKYAVVDLRTDIRTKATYERYKNSSAYEVITNAFNDDVAAFMKKHGELFIKLDSLLFCYEYVLAFLAGTDNSSKNTYYVTDPIAQDMSANTDSDFSSWFSSNFGYNFDYTKVYQIYLHGDDMDSILPTNNKGNLTKPYYIERLYPYADDNPNQSLYEGMHNQLFNFVERAFTDTERSAMLNKILTNATGLVSKDDILLGTTANKESVWGFLHKYFFNVQNYFPQISYIEQARIRYEFVELIGNPSAARGVKPISQSIGAQLEYEQQFMEQRVVYMASFATYGDLGDGKGSIGINDTVDGLSFQAAPLRDGSPATITFTLTPHQYLYPCGFNGQTIKPSFQRTSPKQTCTLTIADNITSVSDTTMGIRGVNYYSDLGDLSTISTQSAISINGKRLTRFVCWYIPDQSFRPTTLALNTPNATTVELQLGANLSIIDISQLTRLRRFVVGNYAIYQVITPETHTLSTLRIDNGTREIALQNVPNLKDIKIRGRALQHLHIGSNVGTNTNLSSQSVAQDIYDEQKSNRRIESIHIENVNWTDFDVNALSWYADIPTCEFKGTISIREDHPQGLPRVTWDLKNKFIKKFGAVDNKASTLFKGLALEYAKREFLPEQAYIKGNFYVETGNTLQFELRPSSVYQNTQSTFTWKQTGVSGNINPQTGLLTVNKLSDAEAYGRIYIDIYYYKVDTKHSILATIEKTIEIWNRPAQVGDLVYADGTFSSAKTWDKEKTPIGICFYVPPRDDNGNVLPKFANPNDKQLRLMVALEETRVNINGALTSLLQWGAQVQLSGQTDDWTAQNALYDTDDEGNRVNLTSSNTAKVPSVYDIHTIDNLSNKGLDNTYIDPDPTTNPNGASDYRDTSTNDGLMNDGFKCVTPDNAIGDGFAYKEDSVTVNTIGDRTLTSDLAKLASGIYKEGDIVNSGYAKTLKIIQHRNDLLNNNIIGADGEVIYTGGTYPLPTASGSVSEINELGKLIDRLRTWAANKNGSDEPYPTKWQQLAYPFVSACYAYQPTQSLQDGEVLADKFKSHNWFAPTEGHIARICWYAKYGTKGGFDAFKDARERGILGNLSTISSHHWSVTEYNSSGAWNVNFGNGNAYSSFKYYSMVGRAVSAF